MLTMTYFFDLTLRAVQKNQKVCVCVCMCLWTGNAPVFCADQEEDAAETTRLNFLIAITVETVCIKAEELGGRADRAICCLQ